MTITPLPFALAAVKGQARWRGYRRSPLTAASLRKFSNCERHGPLYPQTVYN